MTIEKNRVNGSWMISTRNNEGTLIKHQYYGYSKAQAKNLFLKELADIIVKEIKSGKIKLQDYL